MVAKAKKSRGTTKSVKTPGKRVVKQPLLPWHRHALTQCASVCHRIVQRNRQFLARRPHRSFVLTRRRDYVRSLSVEGYVMFTLYVNRTLRKHWRMFGVMIVIYASIMVALGAVTNQATYSIVDGLLRDSTTDFFGSGIGQVGQAGVIALSAFVGSANNLAPDQHVYLIISLIFAWLATVWLLREILLGRKPKLRDGLYNSGAPVLATVGVMLVLVVQLLPIALVALAYAALSSFGAIDGGFGGMLFWLIVAVIVALVLYWITSTIIALVVVTLPGMYPLHAVKLASDLVIGRRLRIMLRLLWGLVLILISWAVIIILVILIDNWVGLFWPAIDSFPVVPYCGAFMTAYGVVWYATYVYLFYRKIVDDHAKPA